MSIDAKRGVALTLWRGRSFLLQGTIYTNAARTAVKDLTGYAVRLLVTGTDPERALFVIAPGGTLPSGASEGATGSGTGGTAGTYFLYATNENTAGLDETLFRSVQDNAGFTSYGGDYQIVFDHPTGERYTWFYGLLALKLGAPLVVT